MASLSSPSSLALSDEHEFEHLPFLSESTTKDSTFCVCQVCLTPIGSKWFTSLLWHDHGVVSPVMTVRCFLFTGSRLLSPGGNIDRKHSGKTMPKRAHALLSEPH